MDSENKALYIVGWVMLGILILVFVIERLLSISLTSVVGPCLIHSYSGLYCPGCGGTRAILNLGQGKVLRSFLSHPVVLYTIIIYVGYMVTNTIQLMTKGRFMIGMKYKDTYLWIALWIIIINCIVKNVVYIGWGISLIK